MNYKHLFGPVPSRRLGISLGIDLVPSKVCSLDCLYCEAGATSNKTISRKEYIPFYEIINELDDYLKNKPHLDYLTFSGQGEPTLNSRIGDIIKHINRNYPQYKICLITNSNLLYNKQLRDEIRNIDLILPSLDAASNEVFRKINKNHAHLDVNKIINGLIDFNKNFDKPMWLEVFVIEGINDHKEELQLLKNAIIKIKPTLLQINSLDRPGTDKTIKKASIETLKRIADFFSPLNVEIIARYKSNQKVTTQNNTNENLIKEILKRRPCTLEDLNQTLGLAFNELQSIISIMEQKETIKKEIQERGIFYTV